MSPSASYIRISKPAWDLRDSGWEELSSWETAWPAYTENISAKTKDSAVYRYYQEDSVLHPLFYLLGSIFAPDSDAALHLSLF